MFIISGINFLDVVNVVWPILVAILVFGLIIFVHELGHFLLAKLFRVRVNEFAIGFGPAFFTFTKGETKYALRILPFGGYCNMEGQDGKDSETTSENEVESEYAGDDDKEAPAVDEAEDDRGSASAGSDKKKTRAFYEAKIYQRILIIAGGAIFNIILGFFIMLSTIAMVGAVSNNNLIATTEVARFTEEATTNNPGGLQEGDVIRRIDGRRALTVDELTYFLGTARSNRVDVTVLRDGQRVELRNVEFPQREYEGRTFLDIDFYFRGEPATFLNVISQSFWRTVSTCRIVFISLSDMISGRFGLNEISGPVGITQIVSGAVTNVRTHGVRGLIGLFRILTLLTVNLGIFNLLPIPALDGGRIWFLVVEGIRRKPIKNEALVHGIGFAVLIALMVLILFNDLWSWIR